MRHATKEAKEPRQRREVNLYLDVAVIEEIDRIAEKAGLSRSRFARNLLLLGLDEARTLDAFGLFTLVRKFEKLAEAMKREGKTSVVQEA